MISDKMNAEIAGSAKIDQLGTEPCCAMLVLQGHGGFPK